MPVVDLTRPLTGQCQYRGRMAQACLWFITIPSPGHIYGSLVNLNPQRAIAEIGDKTQLLALLLICRFRKPWPIIAGMLVATLLNHAGAAWIGEFISSWMDPKVMTWLVAGAFIAMAVWILVPDKMDDEESSLDKYGPFMATFVLFFIAEIGDKTQIATVLLAAKYDSLTQVITGTTIGMMLANVPVVLLGKLGADKLPLKGIRIACAILFVGLGASTLIFV